MAHVRVNQFYAPLSTMIIGFFALLWKHIIGESSDYLMSTKIGIVVFSLITIFILIKNKTLGQVKCSGRKIAVLGDMLELGKHTEEAHKNVGRAAKENCDVLIVVGPRAQAIKEGAMEVYPASGGAGMNPGSIFEFLKSSEAGKFMETFVQKGDLVLVKGSQGMRMERVVEAILFDKENKNKLLVRQDEEWLKKK